jgi:dethiobiotin synthase
MNQGHKTVFITGTNTDVGKTFVSTWICYHTQADYWKPIQTGEKDSETIRKFSHQSTIHPENYHFHHAVSPHLAAQEEKIEINLNTLNCPLTSNPLVIEGAGGVLVPLNQSTFVIDLIKKLQAPVLIVAKNVLGTINHTCLTVEALKKRSIPILGIILNGDSDLPNKDAIETYSNVPVLACLPFIERISVEILKSLPLPKEIKGAFK